MTVDPQKCARCGRDIDHHEGAGHEFVRVTGPPKPHGGWKTGLVWVLVIVVLALVAFCNDVGALS